MESKGDALAVPLLSGASDSKTLDTDGTAPNDIPGNPNMPVPGPVPEEYPQRTPAQQMYPAAQPAPQYPPPQPYPQYQPPPSQYQPYQPQPAAQHAVPGPTTPYMTYDSQMPLRTSKTFEWKTLHHNQYYLSICLCIALVVLCNPLGVICCVPAFCFASKAINENNDDYDNALSLEKKAKCLNYTGIMYLTTAATFVFGIGLLFAVICLASSSHCSS